MDIFLYKKKKKKKNTQTKKKKKKKKKKKTLQAVNDHFKFYKVLAELPGFTKNSVDNSLSRNIVFNGLLLDTFTI
jgi:hypothetical protein